VKLAHIAAMVARIGPSQSMLPLQVELSNSFVPCRNERDGSLPILAIFRGVSDERRHAEFHQRLAGEQRVDGIASFVDEVVE
jgi:hypothetical protein